MNITEFIGKYHNHPILFVGTGISLRYLKTSYSWNNLLQKICFELKENHDYFLDLKAQNQKDGIINYSKIASILELEFTKELMSDRNGKFKEVNDKFYELANLNINATRLKIYISMLLSSESTKFEMKDELTEFKKIGKNIGSIVTTNYDNFIESFLDFSPLIGNDILLSNPYGSVYKIHGCISTPEKIIISEEDYIKFNKKYELIRAQLLSLFIHNPIIFIGYSVSDENIKSLLKTVFSYVDPTSEQAVKIKNNFLLVEHEVDSDNDQITDYDIDIEGFPTIRINKIKTNNFSLIYKAISELNLPISAMDIRKVQNIVKDIYAGTEGTTKVLITEDLDSLKPSDKILAIGSKKSIQYQHMTVGEVLNSYFKIIEEANTQVLELIDKFQIQSSQWFPIFAFKMLLPSIGRGDALAKQQIIKLDYALEGIEDSAKNNHSTVIEIIEDLSIPKSLKTKAVLWSLMNNNLMLEEVEALLKDFSILSDNVSDFRKILCAYDYKKYAEI